MLVPNEAVTRPSIATLAEPIMAESGTYEVQDWQIQGDRITLALTAGEESSEKLTVSLPLEALKATRQGRVSLNPLTADRTAMAQALKLDKVTAISIQVDENTGATEPTTAVKCTLLNDDDASVAVAQLPRSEVKALRVRALDNKRSSESSIQNFKNSLSDSKSPTTAQTTASSIAPKAAESVELARLTQRYGLDTEKVWGMAGKVESGSGGTLSSDQTVQVSAGESTAIESRSDSKATSDLPRQAVVFRLPEKIEKPSSGTTRTLRLSIEPEHLGPARLTLTERNGEMHARVTVPTQEAKSLVEGNLDRLVRQLADADVQLDRLEVALDNQEEEGRFQERPGHSRPKVKPRAEFDINEITTAPSEPTSTAWVPPATEAVAGLDLLA